MNGTPRFALPLYKNFILLSEKRGSELNTIIGLSNIAHMVQLHCGALKQGEDNLLRSIGLCAKTRNKLTLSWEATNLSELGRFHIYRGNWTTAEQVISASLELFFGL